MKELNKSCSNCFQKNCVYPFLTEKEKNQLDENSKRYTLKKGEKLLRQQENSSHLIYIREGLLKETLIAQNHTEQIFSIVKNNSFWGFQSLLGEDVNPFTYIALNDIDFCFIEKETIKILIKTNGSLAFHLLEMMYNQNMSGALKMFYQSKKTAKAKVAEALLYFSDFIFEKNEFYLPLSREEIASFIGISRESVSRILSKLTKDKIISVKQNYFQITDLKQLAYISYLG